MKKVFIALIITIGLIIGTQYVHLITFVPYVSNNSNIEEFENSSLVTIPRHFYELKLKFPKIQKIDSVETLEDTQIILLPWNQTKKKLTHLKINGHSFYESKNGTIQVHSIRKSDDGYNEFLKNKVVLTAGGTVVLARGVHYVIQKNNDIHFPWGDTQSLFNNSDINIINFKSPLIDNYTKPNSRWLLYGKKEYVKSLVKANINIAAIAGNHMGDAGSDGLIQTINTLNENNIQVIGAGINKEAAYKCLKVKEKNMSFGFLSFNNVPGSIKKATDDTLGIAWLDSDAQNAIKSCKSTIDQLVVLVNWGIEYVHEPREKEVEIAHKMVENGATLIIGDQAHWVQSHEKINGNHISYGLGNYIFDQHWSENTTEGIIQKYVFHKNKIIYIDTIPIKLQKNGAVKTMKKTSKRYKYVMNAYNKTKD